MTKAFNAPPHWPEPPQEDWRPPEQWQPDSSWGAVPAGWRLWVEDPQAPADRAPLEDSEEIPASGARVRARVEDYPVTVVNPGMWSENQLEVEDYGFPPEKPRRRRERLRRTLTIVVALLGVAAAVLTALLFVRLVQYAQHDLPTTALASVAAGADHVEPGSGALDL